MEKRTVTIVSDAAEAGTGYIECRDNGGRLIAFGYTKGDYADGHDFVATIDGTGEAVMTRTNQNASAIWYPRAAVQDVLGAAAFYAATFAIVEPLAVPAGDRIKVVVAQAGVTKTGSYFAIYD